MIKTLKNKLFATLCVTALTLGAVTAASTFNSVQAADKTVYVDVEKNITGQDPILAPKAVTIDDSKTVLDATKQAAGSDNVASVPSYYGNYVTAFKDNTADFVYAYKDKIPVILYDTQKAYKQSIINDPTWLREKEYNGISGWMFTVNNAGTYTDTNKATQYYKGDTTLTNVPNGAVIRWEFSMASGADLGLDNAYLPTAAKADGYYDWNTSKYVAPFFPRANKTDLITKLATTAKPAIGTVNYTQYVNAENALKNLTISQDDVDDCVTALH
ncbi:hypothetical protein HBE96_12825 [Clostridium sp. P21]|uniref:Uncharacterized protein n=1 Tax=Clostridium muellerianum TaxID=2716538 RepID=A0A7Y0HPB3_9CLOT|nr:hypothetical protein [Clostridium muellerianum]NMM63542.1 hypothetical protein [Clostridium muellerianum]